MLLGYVRGMRLSVTSKGSLALGIAALGFLLSGAAASPKPPDAPMGLTGPAAPAAPSVAGPEAVPLPFGTLPLKDFRFPTEVELLERLGWTDRQAYEQSLDVVTAWTRGKRFPAVDESCARNLDISKAAFPMTPFNLRCVPWWLESRSFKPPLPKKQDSGGAASTATPQSWGNLVTLKDWMTLKGASYRDFLRRFRPKSKDQVLAQLGHAMNPAVTCDFAVPIAAMIGRAEEFLPDAAVWEQLVALYQKYATCERPDDQYRETVHLRTGLAAVYFGDFALARQALARALEAPAQEDRQRALFWLGLLIHTDGEQEGLVSHFRNRFWTQLLRESPISIHAVIAQHLQGIDPYENLLGDVVQPVASRDGQAWSDYNLVSVVSELLIARDDAVSLNAWSRRLARDWKETDLDRILYIAHVHSRAHNYLQSIQLLTVYLKATAGQKVRLEFLKLLFPTPFSDSILAASGGLDPLVVFGLIRQESAFNPQARSIADARGLMQLLPGTARTMAPVTPGELYDPRKNVALGSQYLRKLLAINNNHLESVLAAYNAGQRHIPRWTQRFPGASDLLFSDLIPFRETRSYVSLIQRNSYWYGRLVRDGQDHYGSEFIARIEKSNIRSRTVDGLLRLSWGRAENTLTVESLMAPARPAALETVAQ